ncbi:spermidine synthase [Pseudodesulfovibrio sp. S3]|uniref:spermine/spermidine synthase domain-containing protein n=1 Tax=unclassified Pseudodesulfovibrio TaxID=2661612 RepID=UPI000FEB7B64|nr:spermidine synthase [Pseudodesulfovibrio sp. S3]MCJ2165469.1 spermidine synthase [Pseudodesulfovibrio sp. S3-i]RWU03217.1 spermidine synthase [Pseudodesulfovibrio sp. S3]
MAGSKLTCDYWITEYMTQDDVHLHGVEQILEFKRTEYQEMSIVRSKTFGTGLVLDGKWQTTVLDEFLYHEPLVHTSMHQHGSPSRVLVLGGADGGAVREVLKWKSVTEAVQVEIDEVVFNACQEHLGEIHQGCFEDPRAEIRFGDAFEVLENQGESWDVIICDLSDPLEDSPAMNLFTREFFTTCRNALAPGGVFTIQAGPVTPPFDDNHAMIVRTLGTVFENVAHFFSCTPTYVVPLGFAMGSLKPVDTNPDPETVDAFLAAAVEGELRFFDGIALRGLMSPPKYLRDKVGKGETLSTLKDPARYTGTGVRS